MSTKPQFHYEMFLNAVKGLLKSEPISQVAFGFNGFYESIWEITNPIDVIKIRNWLDIFDVDVGSVSDKKTRVEFTNDNKIRILIYTKDLMSPER